MVVVTADTYDAHPAWDLPSARRSGQVICRAFERETGVRADDVQWLQGREVTAELVERAIEKAGERMRGTADPLLVVYWVGHGWVRDGEPELFTHVTRDVGGQFEKTVRRRDLIRWLTGAAAEVGADLPLVLVVDACRPNFGAPPPRATLVPGEVWEYYGAADGQFAAAGNSGEMFVFSGAFVDAMRALGTEGGQIPLQRVFASARARTSEATEGRQTPEACLPTRSTPLASPILRASTAIGFGLRVVDAGSDASIADARVRIDAGDELAVSDSALQAGPGDHVLVLQAKDHLPRTIRCELTPSKRGAIVTVPLLPAMAVVRGRIEPAPAAAVRVRWRGERPIREQYHQCDVATADGGFVLRVPSLSGRIEVWQDDRPVYDVPLADNPDGFMSDVSGRYERMPFTHVVVRMARDETSDAESPLRGSPPVVTGFAEAAHRTEWELAMKMLRARRLGVARDMLARLPIRTPGVAAWRVWIDSRWVEEELERGLDEGVNEGDWERADRARVWLRDSDPTLDNESRVAEILAEIDRERIPAGARSAYRTGNEAYADGRLEDALAAYEEVGRSGNAHYRSRVVSQLADLRSRLYERHMNAAIEHELFERWQEAFASYCEALRHNSRALGAIDSLLARRPELDVVENRSRLRSLTVGRLPGEWICAVLDATPGATGYPRRVLDLRTGIELILVDPGSFAMGSHAGDSDERPVHKVTISKPFYLAATETTQEQWQTVMDKNPCRFRGQRRPVETVSRPEISDFLAALNRGQVAGAFRLPTEAEWEYACRAGGDEESLAEAGGGSWSADGAPSESTADVASFPANAWGFFDMRGNVWECCSDRYALYRAEEQRDPVGPAAGDSCVLRGGSWSDPPRYCRAAERRIQAAGAVGIDNVGFRVARSL